MSNFIRQFGRQVEKPVGSHLESDLELRVWAGHIPITWTQPVLCNCIRYNTRQYTRQHMNHSTYESLLSGIALTQTQANSILPAMVAGTVWAWASVSQTDKHASPLQYRQLNSQTPLPPPLQLSDRCPSFSLQLICQLAGSWRKQFRFQHSCTRPPPPDMVHRRQLPSPYCKMMLPRCKRKPNKLPILQNLCLCLAECRHSTNRYTAALFQRSLTIRYQFSPPRPGLCFTTRKTTSSYQGRHFPQQRTWSYMMHSMTQSKKFPGLDR